MNISLKSIRRKDLPYLWKTYTTALKQHIETIWGWDEEWQKSDFSKSLTDYQTSIIVCGGVLVGYIQFKSVQPESNSEDIYINMIILQAEYQSKGIGAKLLAKIQTMHKKTTLKCFKVNKDAYRFYLSNDFEVVSEGEHFYLLSRTSS